MAWHMLNHGIIRTTSGAEYFVEERNSPNGSVLFVREDGPDGMVPTFALFPNRLKDLATVTHTGWSTHDRTQAVGWNAQGNVTLRFNPMRVRKGMFLVTAQGPLSTEIVSVPLFLAEWTRYAKIREVMSSPGW